MWRILLTLCLTITFAHSSENVIVFAEEHEQSMQSLLADARSAQSRGDFSQAAAAYRRAVALEPDVPELRANLGLMDYESGNHAEAIRSFEEAIRQKPSLFVPQLFLGMEYLRENKARTALPYIENAVRLNPDDPQAALSLGKAYEILSQPDRAARACLRAVRIAPNNGEAWVQLGTVYLEQVENDARRMTSEWSSSEYVQLIAAETYADEGNFGPAEIAFRVAIGSAAPAPCAHAEFGILLLREGKDDKARRQFEIEMKGAAPCRLALLGLAIADIAQGHVELALKELTSLAKADPGFVRSSLPLFRSALSPDQARAFIRLAQSQSSSGNSALDLGSLVERVLVSGDFSIPADFEDGTAAQTGPTQAAAGAARLYASGHFSQCEEILKPALDRLPPAQLQLLASCSYFTGDFVTASFAGGRAKSYPGTIMQGLYWESKADEKLAVAALARAGEIDPDSPALHVLIGNAFRQQRHWSEAEAEYRKALVIDPANRAARLSLGIVLLTELKTDEAFELDKSLLAETPDGPEANLLAAEILVQEHKFSQAQPYLLRCRNLKPELASRVHILLGRVYAETGRTVEAIAEYKQGLSTDEDGSLHYQLARLYKKSGNSIAAATAMRRSQQLRQQWDDQAHIDLGQPLSRTGSQ